MFPPKKKIARSAAYRAVDYLESVAPYLDDDQLWDLNEKLTKHIHKFLRKPKKG